MSLKPSVAVVIPAYNEEDFIGRCLVAVTTQTHLPDEIIVVDNNSTDGTAEIVRGFDGVTLVAEKVQGRGAARRKGFDTAGSDILVRIDADSVPSRNWLSELIKSFEDDNTADAWTGFITPNEAGGRKIFELGFNFFTFDFNKLISGHHNTFGSNMAFRRELWERYKADIRDSELIWEDLEIACVLARAGHKIILCRQPFVAISIRLASGTPRYLYRRLACWPRTYWRYNKFAAVMTALAIPGALILDAVWQLMSGAMFTHWRR